MGVTPETLIPWHLSMPQVGAEDPPGAREAPGQKELQVLKEGGLGCVHKPAGNKRWREQQKGPSTPTSTSQASAHITSKNTPFAKSNYMAKANIRAKNCMPPREAYRNKCLLNNDHPSEVYCTCLCYWCLGGGTRSRVILIAAAVNMFLQ